MLDLVISSLGAMSSPVCAACLGCRYPFTRLLIETIAFRSSIILPLVHTGPCGPTPRYLRPSCGRRNPPMIAQRATAGTGSRVRVSYRSKFRPAAHQSVALGGDEIGPVRTGKIHAPPPLLGFSAPNSRVQPADSQTPSWHPDGPCPLGPSHHDQGQSAVVISQSMLMRAA
jgi:hypothetical protein